MVFKVDVPTDLIDGDVDEGYAKVADAFRANFAAGTEVSAALAVYRDGVTKTAFGRHLADEIAGPGSPTPTPESVSAT